MKYSVNIFVIAFLLSSFAAIAQKKQERDCATNCFQSSVVSSERISDSCTAYELKVAHNGNCRYALSHFTIGIPCGEVSGISNSQNWKQSVGLDPTTGLNGLKIDDIQNFGDNMLREFTVRFTLCGNTATCQDELSCWEPVVAYKASNCVHYDTLDASCQALTALLQKEDVSCNGAADGKLSVAVESGKEPYTFLWSTGATTSTLTGLSAGTYNVVVSDASGSSVSLEGVIDQPASISVNETIAHVSCSGVGDGSIALSVSGGIAPYAYLWNTGATTAALQNVAVGNYTVTITDAVGCTKTSTYAVSSQVQISVAVTKTQPDCNVSSGSINLSVSGGTAPYSYQWSDGYTGQDRANLGAGFYTVTITDSNGCSTQTTVSLTENNTLKVTANVTPTSCLDDASGAIDLIVSGGTAPYSYQWSGGQTTEDLSSLPSGSHTVIVTDANGCTKTIRVFVPKSSFVVPHVVTQPSCAGGGTGTITLYEPTGGTAPYEYLWSTGATGNTLTELAPGVYSVTVTDATGCSRELFFVITAPQPIVADGEITNQQCSGDGSFRIDLHVSGGTLPYTFNWSTGAVSEDVQNLWAGVYQVQITDANGCTVTKEFVIEEPTSSLTCLIDPLDVMPACGSQNNTLQTQVADADFYSWRVESADPSWSIVSTNGASIIFAAGNEPGTAVFWLTIGKNGCTQTCSYTVNSCVDNGGSDPGGEDPGEGETCDECFSSAVQVVQAEGSCMTYEATIETNGDCRHELSHWTISVPCGEITGLWNSEGWKMEAGTDPTTVLTGLKVDDIGDFGKANASFTVRFTVCREAGCGDWDPVVAYKAGQCVAYDSVVAGGAQTSVAVSAYPNPFADQVTFDWTAADNSDSRLEILDQFGNPAAVLFAGTVVRGASYRQVWHAGGLPTGLYYYKLTNGSKTLSGKIYRR